MHCESLGSSTELRNPRKIRCPIQGCGSNFSSLESLQFHEKYLHGNGYSLSNNDVQLDQAVSSKNAEKLYCQETECFAKYGKNKTFKNYSSLKQHYIATHTKKIYECQKCGRKYSVSSKLKQHQLNCGLKLRCSCGVQYYGKRGLVAHMKLKNHELPDSAKKYFVKKQREILSPTSRFKTPSCNKNALKVNLSKRTPIPILPKGNTPVVYIANSSSTNQQPSFVHRNDPHPIKPKFAPLNLRCKGRFVIDVYGQPENSSNTDQIRTGASQSTHAVLKIDSLSTAMLTSGINSRTPAQFTEIDSLNSGERCNQDKEQAAHDFSCQTDDLLSWLDSETAKCNGLSENSTATICTQTLHSVNSSDNPDLQSRSVAQHETQTDDDWISAFLRDDSVAIDQATPFQHSDTATSPLPYCAVMHEQSCDIQTQTSYIESISHVTTQTNLASCSEATETDFDDPILNYIVSDSQTQTDGARMANVDSAHTQTPYCCEDIVQLLNIETQTDA